MSNTPNGQFHHYTSVDEQTRTLHRIREYCIDWLQNLRNPTHITTPIQTVLFTIFARLPPTKARGSASSGLLVSSLPMHKRYCTTDTRTSLFDHSPSHRLTNPHTHPPPLTQSHHTLTHSLTQSLTRPLTQPLSHPLTHSLIHSHIHSPTFSRPLTHPPTY